MRYNTAFAARFRNLREQIGVSQGEMAERLGISQQAVSLYEKGDRLPDFFVLDRIHKETGCSIKYLFGYQNVMSDRLVNMDYRLELTSISERTIETLLHLDYGYASVINILFRKDSAFWELLDTLIVLSSGEQERNFQSDAFSSGYYDYLCHKEFDSVLAEIREYGENVLSDNEREEIELERQKMEIEAKQLIKKMEKNNAIEEAKDRKETKRILNAFSLAAKGDKFKEFASRILHDEFNNEDIDE